MSLLRYTSSGEKLTIKDIAAMAGVSAGTVDRVIHGRGEVAEETRQLILKIIEQTGFRRNMLASALVSKKKRKIAVMLPSPSRDLYFWKLPQRGIEKAYQEIAPFGVEITTYHFDYENRKDFVRQSRKVLKQSPDGVLLAPVIREEAQTFIESCAARKIPVVVIDTCIGHKNVLSYIGQKAFHSGRVAAHLMHWGMEGKLHFLVVHVGIAGMGYEQLKERAEGFKKYFAESFSEQVKISEISVEAHDQKKINAVLDGFLKKRNSLQGIFVTNSRVYRIASWAASRHMNDLRIAGYDLLEENIKYLKDGTIDFLISQLPEEQAYRGVLALFDYFMGRGKIEPVQYLPIDILTKENIDFYKF